MSVKITFLGAAGTVTGSKYLVEFQNQRILVDVGMFQGERRWREENWAEPVIDLSTIDAVLLTHAHLDHVGLLPRYWKLGLRAPVYCSKATQDLSALILLDSGRLQEEEASYRQEHGRSRHNPVLPLYTEADAKASLALFKSVPYHQPIKILDQVEATWSLMGHILGAAAINLKIGGKEIQFSGDIGRYSVPILADPEPVSFADLLLIESTYGDRLHFDSNIKVRLAEIVNNTAKRSGVLLIPSFAVGRTQSLLFYLRELKAEGAIPDLPVIIDSPMARDATSLYQQNPGDYDQATAELLKSGTQPFSLPKLHFISDRAESIKLNSIHQPMILISASGMLSGGRILHHLKHRISDPRNCVLFVGFQPAGGTGAWIKSGAKTVRILGEEIPIGAEIAEISGLSAHADRDELLRWCRESKGKPGRVAIVHGEPSSAEAFKKSLEKEFGWNVGVAQYRGSWEI